jgi:hypothetical protein
LPTSLLDADSGSPSFTSVVTSLLLVLLVGGSFESASMPGSVSDVRACLPELLLPGVFFVGDFEGAGPSSALSSDPARGSFVLFLLAFRRGVAVRVLGTGGGGISSAWSSPVTVPS